jgi:hypothetical protein
MDQNEIWANVAVSVPDPVARKRVAEEAVWQGRVVGELKEDCGKSFDEGWPVSGAKLAFENPS